MVTDSFSERHRRMIRRTILRCVVALVVGSVLVAATVVPVWLLWWDTVLPAVTTSVIMVLVLVYVVTEAPLVFIGYVTVYARPRGTIDYLPSSVGRRILRGSDTLDALAREAGLPPLVTFSSPDPADRERAAVWHQATAALPTLRHLLAKLPVESPLRSDLARLASMIETAARADAQFYFIVLSYAAGTNSTVEAVRHGEPPYPEAKIET